MLNKRIMPDIIQGVFNADLRRGLWWYEPQQRTFYYSDLARTHFQLEAFSGLGSVKDWVRGAVVAKDGSNYILIYLCDFNGRDMAKGTLKDIYSKVRQSFDSKIVDIFSEEGVLLDAGPWND